MSERLTPEEREFLTRISRGEKPGVADRARQHCRRNGLAEWSRGSWSITQEGRAALSREEGR